MMQCQLQLMEYFLQSCKISLFGKQVALAYWKVRHPRNQWQDTRHPDDEWGPPICASLQPIWYLGLEAKWSHLRQKTSPSQLRLTQIATAQNLIINKGFSSIQSLSRVRLFATPWTTARQASLSITNSRSPPKPMSIESMIPCNHLILCRPLLLLPSIFPTSGFFQMSQLFTLGSQSVGVSASTSVLPKNTQDWSPLGWTGWISLQSKGLSRVFSNTTVQKHQFFNMQE